MSNAAQNSRDTLHPSAPSGRPGETLSAEEQRRVMSSLRLSVLLMSMVVIIVALLGTMVFLLVDRIFDTLTPSIRHDLEWKARHGVIELCSTADLGVIANDRESVATAAAQLVTDADVVAIHVTNAQGNVYDYARVPFDWDKVRPVGDEVVQHAGLLIASHAVEIEGIEVGRGWLAISTDRLQAGISLRNDILIAGAVGAALALLLALAFLHLYISPLLRMTAGAFRKLERTTLAALESARIKSEFLANMSHEIRTPMNGIMGVTKLAMALPMNDKLRRYMEVIDTSARGLLTIINDILDFSKIEAGKYEIHPRAFELRAVVAESVQLFSERAREKGLALAQHVASDVPHELIGDADRIRQVLVNLIGNAIKFTDAGEVFVHATCSAKNDQRCVRISVRDTGCGISAAAQGRLFQAFTQVDGSSVRQHGGTGLGLAIAKRLAELMGGEIGLRSAVGQGSEFWFTVVVGLGRESERRGPPTMPRIQPRVRRELHTDRPVLVVDDNEINRFVAVEHLSVLGFRAETVPNGAEAVEAVFAREYAAVLMDCQMPVMDGYDATREIRRREMPGQHVPIIAVTAHALVGERDNVLAAGMDDYIPKPVHPSVLERALLHWIGINKVQNDRDGVSAEIAIAGSQPGTSPANDIRAGGAGADLDPGVPLSPRLLELFLRHAPAQMAELLTHLQARSVEPARAAAHRLKGGLYAVSASGLADELEALRGELACEAWDAIGARVPRVAARFAAVVKSVQLSAAESGESTRESMGSS